MSSTPFHGALLLREARRRAGLTQRELARRAGTSQSVIARIEQDRTAPGVDTLSRLLAAAGFAVRVELTPLPVAETHMLDDVARILALTPEQRLLEVRNATRFEAAVRRA
jgi:transcriptional regulator with XRE-family HTH domain